MKIPLIFSAQLRNDCKIIIAPDTDVARIIHARSAQLITHIRNVHYGSLVTPHGVIKNVADTMCPIPVMLSFLSINFLWLFTVFNNTV